MAEENNLELFNEILKGVEKITVTKHFKTKAESRGIKEADVVNMLRDSKNLVAVTYQGYENGRHKYGILFKILSNYDLKVVVSVSGKELNIVTAHIQNVKKRKRFLTWLQK